MTGSGHMARYSAATVASSDDGRLFSPSFERNFAPIRDALAPHLKGARGTVLEIGCGTGQHVANLANAYPALTWLPSDIDDGHRYSAAAWIAHTKARNVEQPVHLDASADWAADDLLLRHLPLAGVLSCNVIHIAPWAVAEGIVSGAGEALARGCCLIFYGPFKEDGCHTGEGNAAFDAALRADNADWGVRDVGDIAEIAGAAGLDGPRITPMPSNNRLVVFQKR